MNALGREPTGTEKFFGYVGLCLGILANTSIGPMFKYMNQLGVPSCLSSAWRNECILIYVVGQCIEVLTSYSINELGCINA
jgi:hypothetical protein